MSDNQKLYVNYIINNPGCSKADVTRACKRNPLAGHKWIYDSISRLIRRKIVKVGTIRPESNRGGAYGLYCNLEY